MPGQHRGKRIAADGATFDGEVLPTQAGLGFESEQQVRATSVVIDVEKHCVGAVVGGPEADRRGQHARPRPAVTADHGDRARRMSTGAPYLAEDPDEVRVVEIGGPFSMELCGGTHVQRSAQIGPVTILGESSVGSGVRRVEAYVGLDSFRHLAKERALMAGLASSLKVPSEEVPARVATLVEKLKAAEKELDKVRLAGAKAAAANAAAGAELIGKVRVVAQRMAGVSGGDLRTLVGDIKGKLGSEPAVIALIADAGDSVPYVVAVNPAAQDLGLKANELVQQLGAAVGGRGGGKADLAQGSGKGAAGIDAGLAALRAELGRS